MKGARDYRQYQCSFSEKAGCLLFYLGIAAMIGILFYNTFLILPFFLPGYGFFYREYAKSRKKRREKEICRQFLDGMRLTAAALQAGYAFENAFSEALIELKKMYQEGDFIMEEFRLLTGQLQMNQRIELLLLDLGRRSGMEEIQSFAEVLDAAKRTGGDLILVIRNTMTCIQQRQETLQEIETELSGKRMEQNVMCMIPILILLYVRLTSPDFLSSVYGNPAGISVMSLCLAVYLFSVFWGRRIIEIRI